MSLMDQLKTLLGAKSDVNTLDDSMASPDAGVSIVAPRPTRQGRHPDPMESRMDVDDDVQALVSMPLLGRRTAVQHQRTLAVLLAMGLVVLGGVTFMALGSADKVSQQVASTGQALMQSQRLAKSVSQALVGSPSAFKEVQDSSSVLGKTLRGLQQGDTSMSLDALSGAYAAEMEAVAPLVDNAEKNAAIVLGQEKILLQVGTALRAINRQSSDLLEVAETVSSLKLQQNAPAAEISAAGQLVMLTQRIGKSANEFLTMEGVSPEAVFLLGKDLNSFREIATGLLKGQCRAAPGRGIRCPGQGASWTR
jgi:twitching motility protein PilJ